MNRVIMVMKVASAGAFTILTPTAALIVANAAAAISCGPASTPRWLPARENNKQEINAPYISRPVPGKVND